MSCFSILRNSQLESDVFRLPYSWFAATWQGDHVGGQNKKIFPRRICMKIDFSSQRREMLLFLTTNMAAATSRANQQYVKLNLSIVIDFSWDDCNTQENLETIMVMQNCGGWTRWIMIHVKKVNVEISTKHGAGNKSKYWKVSEAGRSIFVVSENSRAKYATIIGLSVYPFPTQPSFVYAVSTLPINRFFFFFHIAFVALGIVMRWVLPWRRGLEEFSRAEKLWVAPNLLAAPLPPPSPPPQL